MKLLQFNRNGQVRLGVKTELGVLDVEQASLQFKKHTPIDIQVLIESGREGLNELNSLVALAQTSENGADLFLEESGIQHAPVVTNPEKIICVGLNYVNHAEESKMDIPDSPILFSKFNNSLSAHGDLISIPSEAKKIDYEAELVLVIGKTAKNVSKEDALSYVFGYTVGNDLSARDLQFKTGQWLLGKSLDGFAPIGPYIVTVDELPDPFGLDIKCNVNGVLRQSANTRDMIFDCATIISYVSQHMTLKPGDVIFTGTPDGVILGYPEQEQNWLKAGDEIVVSIEKIGSLTNRLA
jgi:2-keto-4-pentenoate hydratase/2-oxohepta-3-ene-1,7-dioic acid hydratase in catechol pathway